MTNGLNVASIVALVIASALVLRATAAPPGNADYWTFVWGDEFSGTAIDATKWSWGQLPWGGNYHNNQYASVIQAADSYLDGSGHLVLRNRAGTFSGSDGNHHSYSEGFVYSNGKFRYTYGYVEVSASYANDANGSLWPAFWTLSDGWPPEFDIAEYFSGGNYLHMALYDNNSTWNTTTVSDPNFASYHTYGLDWGENYANWFKDGATAANVSSTSVPNQTMYFLLNSGVATSPGPNGSAAFPYYSYFDYLRLYKRSELVYNGDFEAYYGAWNLANNASAAAGQGIGGGVAMRLDTDTSGVVNSTASQTIYGLRPNTAYVLTGWYHNDAGVNSWWPGLNVSVTDTGGRPLAGSASGGNPNWTQASVVFTNGAVATNATISFQVQPTWGRIYLDNILLRRAATVNNPGFESNYLDPYWNKSGNSWLLQYSPRSGLYAAQFHSGSSLWQEIAGLLPNTAYNLKAWAIGPSWPGLQVAVTNSGGPNASLTISPNGSYTSGTLSFTTGNSTTATVALINTPQSYDYVYFADDLFLAQPLGSPWQGQDLGAVVLSGASGNRGTQIAITGSGADIWGTADAFYYVYEPLTGDGTITTRLCAEQNTGINAKAGVMMRESLSAGARHVLVDWMPQNTVETLCRNATGGSTVAFWVNNVTTEPWLRLKRQGNVFTGYYSLDGTNWTLTTQQTVAMTNAIYVGLAVTSHDTTQMNESVFDRVTVDPSPLALSPRLSGSNVLLSWPGAAVGYSLQTSPALGTGAVWSTVSATPVLSNGLYATTVPRSGAGGYYRLAR